MVNTNHKLPVFSIHIPCILEHIGEGAGINELHHHPQLILHQVGVMELDNTVKGVVLHDHHLNNRGEEV